MNDRDTFRVAGGCWCDPDRTVQQLRLMGHDDACTQARRGWEQNRRGMSERDQRREEERALGALLLADARKALTDAHA